jgi:hypothetical protein
MLDGLRTTRHRLPPFGWPDKRGHFRSKRSQRAPTLYRREGSKDSGVVVYEAAPGWRQCPGCGALHGPAEACSLCGAALRATA